MGKASRKKREARKALADYIETPEFKAWEQEAFQAIRDQIAYGEGRIRIPALPALEG